MKNQLTKIGKYFLITFVALLLLIILLPSDTEDKVDSNQKKSVTTEKQTEVGTNTSSDEAKNDLIKSYIEEMLHENFNDLGEYKVDISDDMVKVTLSLDGMTDSAIMAKYGSQKKEEWDDMVSSFKYMSDNLYKLVKNIDSNKHVSISVLNDKNNENVLLTSLDGAILYDAVND